MVERYDSARVPVTLSAADGAVCVRGDQEALARVLVNLVDNAARFAASRVEVNLVAADGVARLTVTDDGPGVKEADRERVFERFTRLDEARARGTDDSGAGLGLAIVRSIVTSFGGTITLDVAAASWRSPPAVPPSSATASVRADVIMGRWTQIP